jgi:hypothetical protein
MPETNVVFWLEDGVDLTLTDHALPRPDEYKLAIEMLIWKLQFALISKTDDELEAMFSVEEY